MKPVRSLFLAAAVVILGGCASFRLPFPDSAPAPAAEAEKSPQAASRLPAGQIRISDGDGEAVLQTVSFRSGVSSATVERLGKRFGCTGMQGAGLVAGKGPVEVYRMKCDNGTTFMAQCELRQCRPMR